MHPHLASTVGLLLSVDFDMVTRVGEGTPNYTPMFSRQSTCRLAHFHYHVVSRFLSEALLSEHATVSLKQGERSFQDSRSIGKPNDIVNGREGGSKHR